MAGWLYDEWGHLIPGNTLKMAVQRISERAGTRKIPWAMIASEDDSVVGTASLVGNDMNARPDLSPWQGALLQGIGLGND